MLDAFIIDEIKRREHERESDNERPRAELPLPEPDPTRQSDDDQPKRPERGVVIIDYSVAV